MDIIAARNAGIPTREIAEEVGTTHGGLRAKCAREGLSLRPLKNRVRSHREIVQSMKATDAVAYLLDEIEMLTGYQTDEAWKVQQGYGLTSSEAKILLALIAANGRPLTKEYLVTVIGSDAQAKIVDVFVCKMRKKLPEGARIVTNWGVGYAFERDIGFTFPWER